MTIFKDIHVDFSAAEEQTLMCRLKAPLNLCTKHVQQLARTYLQ